MPAEPRPGKDRLGELEDELRRASIFSVRLQFFSAAALTLLALFLSLAFVINQPLVLTPLLALAAWVVLYTLIMGYLALAGNAYWTEKGRLLRLGLILNILTVTLATYLIQQVGGDFYLLYFIPLITASIYFGLRGGLFTALVSGLAYVLTAWLAGATADPRLVYVILVRVAFFFLFAGAIGIMAEGQAAILERLRQAYGRLRQDQAAMQAVTSQLGRKADELSAVSQLSTAAVSILDLDRVFDAVLERATALLRADTASLMLLNANTGLLQIKAVKGLHDALLTTAGVRPGEGIAGWVAAQGRPLIVQGQASDPRFAGLSYRSDAQSAVCVPIKYQDETVGVLSVSTRRAEVRFTEEDQGLLATFAGHVSLAVRNAQLYDQTLRESERVFRLQQAKADLLFTAIRESTQPLQRLRTQVSELVQSGRLAPDLGQELRQTLNAEEQRVSSVTDRWLGVSAADAVTAPGKPRPLELQPLLALVAEEVKRRSPQHTVTIDLPPDLAPGRGDLHGVAEVARILLGNIVQLTPQGGAIHVGGDQDLQYVHISIGSGQAKEPAERLDDFFKRFLAGSGDQGSGDQPGSHRALEVEMERLGLQLFTAKGLLEAWGGRLRIAGGLSADTVFRFSLPRA